MRAAVVLAVACVAAGVAHAQPVDVPALIKLIDQQPNDMDRTAWKEKRRDAAKRLAQAKDKRAVPVLIKLADTETFDIIGEIAIEGLGALGDQAAVPTLQKIVNDPARDRGQRDLARKALAKLGAAADTPPNPPRPPDRPPDHPIDRIDQPDKPDKPPDKPDKPADTLREPVHGGGKASAELPAAPALPDDVLAAYERLTFAGGTANLGYDTLRKRTDFDADFAGLYQKRVERPAMAYGYDAAAHVVAGYINPDGRAQSRGLEIDATADGEARIYSGGIYGFGHLLGATQITYVAAIDATDPTADVKDTRYTADLQFELGAGYGRVLDVGAAIRVRRLSRTLDAAHALGKPITQAVAKQLELAWWSLRAERSTYRALVATVAILRDAGILLGEPDAGLAYEILNVLRDSQLYLRPQGLDIQLGFGESYLVRPDDPMNPPVDKGRVEQLLAAAGYGSQVDDDTLELSGSAYARLRVLTPDMTPSPYGVGAIARMRKFTYGEHGDPYGALDLSAAIDASTDDRMGSKLQQRITGQIGFTWWINQASGLRLAGTVIEDTGELFIGAQLQATYGFLDATFAHL